MDCSSPPPSSSIASGSEISSQISKDHILNMSPRPSLNPSSDKIVKELARLEFEIVHLERYILSLYRTAFQSHLPSIQRNRGTYVQHTKEIYRWVTSDQPSQKMKLEMSKDYSDHQEQSSPTSALSGPSVLVQVAAPQLSAGKDVHYKSQEKKSAYSQHCSLADHLGNSRIVDALSCPDKLSEDIIRCISSIYCKLANPTRTHKGSSDSSNSSFCSSSTFSPRNLSGSWSPQCNDEVTERCFEGLKQDNGPYSATVEVLKISLDNEIYSYAATMLQKFRSLVKSLEIVDLKKMSREQKLAFWINIHNALVMHAYLAYGTHNYIKRTSMKSAYNVGGHCVNAYDIQSHILGIKSHYSAPWLQTLLSPGKKFKTGTTKHAFAIEYPEPLVHFALCSGAYTDAPVRVYTAKNIFEGLKVAREEFIQATVYVHKQSKIYLPKILQYYAKDMSLGMAAVLEMISGCLPGIQQKDIIRKILKGRPEKYVYWLEQSSSFRYLIHKDIADSRWGA